MISILTPVWGQVQYTASYLNTLSPHITPDVEVLIFDNGSNDATPDLLTSWQARNKWLRVMSCPDNLGFARANNILANHVYGDFIIFLNNDIHIDGEFLSSLINPLKENSKQLVGASLVDWGAGWNEFVDAGGRKIIIPYLGGWCLSVTRDSFFELGGFQEIYGICDFEDVDLSKVAVDAGYKLTEAIVPIKHFSGRTGMKLPDRLSITNQNREIFKKRWGLI